MLGGYAASAITALTAQNTVAVSEVMGVPARTVVAQMNSVIDDIGVDVIKTGMLFSAAIVAAVAECCRKLPARVQLVVDPVVLSSTGHELLSREGRETLMDQLLPQAALVTPNVPEATLLTGVPIASVGDLGKAADVLLALGANAVLMKGGHLEGDTVVDLLRTADGIEERFESVRLDTRNTHGTGCTLASGVAAGVAEGLTLRDAVRQARDYVHTAIETAPGLGKGFGPLNHGHPLHSGESDES
jgi:hydroxymethylpyrimidine/phosphomethylpyrimidine kinase